MGDTSVAGHNRASLSLDDIEWRGLPIPDQLRGLPVTVLVYEHSFSIFGNHKTLAKKLNRTERFHHACRKPIFKGAISTLKNPAVTPADEELQIKFHALARAPKDEAFSKGISGVTPVGYESLLYQLGHTEAEGDKIKILGKQADVEVLVVLDLPLKISSTAS